MPSQVDGPGLILPPTKEEAKRDVRGRSLTDPAVTAASARWSSCVKAKGYNWPTPGEAGAEFGDDTAISPAGPRITPSQREIAAARTSFVCQQQTNLVAIWSGFEAKYQKAQIDRHFEELEKIQKIQQNQIGHAADIIAKGR